MRIKLDAKVRTSDGHDAGHVKRAVWDPATHEVASFVVSTGGLLGHDVLISREILERAPGGSGDEMVVDLTKDELNALERYEERGYAVPPIGWTAPAMYDFPAATYLLPVEPVNEPSERAPRPAITRGMRVKDPNGKSVGTVKELRVDDMTGELRSIVVEQDDPLGGGETIEVPADHLDVGDGEAHLLDATVARDAR